MSWREQLYQPMLQRTVENAQLRLLCWQYDMQHASRLAAAIVAEVNQAADADERRRGVQRVRPGELLLRTHQGPVLLPLRTEENIKRALAAEPMRQIRADAVAECLERYRKLCPHATPKHIERLLRALHIGHGCLHKRGPRHPINLPRTERPYGPVQQDETIGQLVGTVESAEAATGQSAPRLGHDRETLQRLMHYLGEQAGVAPAVREPMVLDLLRLRARFCPRINMVATGQMPLVAMHVDTGRTLHQPTRMQPLAPILISPLVAGELKQLTVERYWDYHELMTLHSRRLARVMVEAYQQDGLLSYAELRWCFLASASMVARLVDWYERSHHVVLPCPGSVLDMGRMMTHKDIIVRLYLQGMTVVEISRQTYHAPRSVDAYLRDFDAVLILHLYGLPAELAARVLGRGVALVNEYLALIQEHLTDVARMREYLLNRGVDLPAATAQLHGTTAGGP